LVNFHLVHRWVCLQGPHVCETEEWQILNYNQIEGQIIHFPLHIIFLLHLTFMQEFTKATYTQTFLKWNKFFLKQIMYTNMLHMRSEWKFLVSDKE
jgi:hypothetical protein